MTRRLGLLLSLAAALSALTIAGVIIDPPAVAGAAHVVKLGSLVILLCISGLVYFAAVALVLRNPWPKWTVWLVLGTAAALRLMLLAVPPMLTTDIYRYVWDGRVQAQNISPYRYIPADPALAALRDRTVYPPVAEMVFALAGRLWDDVNSFRLVALAFEALGIGSLPLLLPLAGLPRERILIYAWNPLAVWSFASDRHVDAIAVGFVGLALLLRARHKDGWAGAALSTAVMAKFLPIVVAPALLRGGRFWRPAFAGLAVILLGYAIYSGAGRHVLGFLPGYGAEEGLDSGQGFWLLAGLGDILPLPRSASLLYAGLTILVFAATSIALLRRAPPENNAQRLCRDAGLLIGIALFAISPHYHWYFAWAALPAVVAHSPALLWLATAPLVLIIDPIGHSQFLWPSLIYVPAAALLLLELCRQRALPRPLPAQSGDVSCPLQSH